VPVLVDLSPARTLRSTVQNDIDRPDFTVEDMDFILSRQWAIIVPWNIFLNENIPCSKPIEIDLDIIKGHFHVPE
jgi:hypothetical protein